MEFKALLLSITFEGSEINGGAVFTNGADVGAGDAAGATGAAAGLGAVAPNEAGVD